MSHAVGPRRRPSSTTSRWPVSAPWRCAGYAPAPADRCCSWPATRVRSGHVQVKGHGGGSRRTRARGASARLRRGRPARRILARSAIQISEELPRSEVCGGLADGGRVLLGNRPGRRRRGPWRERIGGIPATRGVGTRWSRARTRARLHRAKRRQTVGRQRPNTGGDCRHVRPGAAAKAIAARAVRSSVRRPHPGSARPGPAALRAGTVRTAHARASGTSGLVTACPTTATRHEERGLNSPPLSLAQPALRPSASRTRSPRSRRPRASKRSGSAVRPR